MQDPKTDYSARVAIWLELKDQCLSVRQVGDNSLILRGNYEVAPSQVGRIIIDVDGSENIYPVMVRSTEGRTVFFGHCERRPKESQATMF